MWSMPSCYKQGTMLVDGARVEAGSNTSTIALRVLVDGEKGTQCLRV
jgi:hypothetical protein